MLCIVKKGTSEICGFAVKLNQFIFDPLRVEFILRFWYVVYIHLLCEPLNNLSLVHCSYLEYKIKVTYPGEFISG